jgi:hypothetical protein
LGGLRGRVLKKYRPSSPVAHRLLLALDGLGWGAD